MKRFTILLFFMLLSGVAVVAAQETAVIRNEAIVDFPNQVTFELDLVDDNQIIDATLTYDVERFSCLDVPSTAPVDVTGNNLSWEWVLTRSGNLPPGTTLWWEWTLTQADGNQFTTPRQSLTLMDDRFEWREIEEAGIHLYWYEGDSVGPTLLDASVTGLQRLESEMGIQLQDDVQLFIYGSAEEMREALLYVQDWAGGAAFPEYNTILMGVEPEIVVSWGLDAVPHELAHLVVGQFGRSCVGGGLPTWLNEGLAMVAEGDASADTIKDLNNGIQNDAFEPLRSLNGSFAADHSAAGLSYSQSYSVVNYMLESYGSEKMQALITAMADGMGYDEALTAVYNLTVDSLEQEWRADIGAPQRSIPPTPTPIQAAAVATYALSGLPEDVPTPPAAADLPAEPAERPSAGICGLGLILPFLFVGISQRKPRRK
ncbi:MAG: hypothetical protein GY943_17220 [Chloroflexi bacterium]|nr:hypothetical protein [Chloroflexota bacterium]